MHQALGLLSELTAEDVAWLHLVGQEQQVIANTLIVREGERPEALFIVLEGLVGIEIDGADGRGIALRGPAELLGEMSFVDDRAASASVKAIENTLLLALSRTALMSRLTAEPAFAARFYRGCARTLSGRLRERIGTTAPDAMVTPHEEGELGSVWARVTAPVEAMKETLRMADQDALRNHGVLPEPRALEIVAGFGSLMEFLNTEIGDASGLAESVRQRMGAWLQRELLPYLLLTRTAERCYSKPRGYAGDYLTIAWMYEDVPQGTGRLGPLFDRCFLERSAARAVRNRRGLLAEYIQEARQRAEGRIARITSLACGPAAEIFDVFEAVDDPAQVHATLIDIDQEALDFVGERCDRLKLRRHMDLVRGNLVYLATGRQKLALAEQDLVYSIGLIDYFNDRFVLALLNYVHSVLRPGGKVVFGNFHPKNPDKVLMDHVLDWKLIHRAESDMNRLFESSNFARASTAIRFEAAGVNMFAECIKGG